MQMRLSRRNAVIVGIGIAGAIFAMSSNMLQEFTSVSATSNLSSNGLRGEVITSDPSITLCKCPYLIRFTTDKLTQIQAFQVCKDSIFCITQYTGMLIDPLRYSNHMMKTAIENDHVPWAVGDDVDIRAKVIPVHYKGEIAGGGQSYESTYLDTPTWLDLGTSKVSTK